MAYSPCADLCVCLSIYQHVNLNAHSVSVCLHFHQSLWRQTDITPGPVRTTALQAPQVTAVKESYEEYEEFDMFSLVFSIRGMSNTNLLTCFSNLNSYSMSVCVCVCVCRLQWHSWRILRKPPICTRLHNSTYSILYRRTDGGRADRGGH